MDALCVEWGMALRANTPGGDLSRRLIGPELDQYLVPEIVLEPGHYRWRVQAACSPLLPFDVSPPSAEASFTIPSADCPATLTDVDGNTYATVPISDQCWMAENLAVTRYRNGDSIPNVEQDTDWLILVSGARAAYGNDPVNVPVYGWLYNWYAVDDARGLCPLGWHVPDNQEWNALREAIGGAAGRAMKAAPSDSLAWDGTNTTGFSALPGGERFAGGLDLNIGVEGFWWSRNEDTSLSAWYRGLSTGDNSLERDNAFKRQGFSLRCLKD